MDEFSVVRLSCEFVQVGIAGDVFDTGLWECSECLNKGAGIAQLQATLKKTADFFQSGYRFAEKFACVNGQRCLPPAAHQNKRPATD